VPIKTFDSLDAIPEAQRSAAIETKAGKFILEEPVDTKTLESTLDKERQKAKDAETARKAAEKERDELKQAREAAEKGISAEELQKIKDAEAAARKPIEEERDKLKAENRRLKLTDRARQLGLDKGIMKERIAAAMKILDGRLDLADDGETIVVKDAAGKVTTESVTDFFEKTFKTEAPFVYQADTGSGSGAGQGGGAASGYDPVAEGKRMAAAEKRTADEKSLALK
jgi:Rad3-related DNA helicase